MVYCKQYALPQIAVCAVLLATSNSRAAAHSCRMPSHICGSGGCRALALLTALLESDPGFGAAQRQQQQQYNRYCQALKRSQRYPALGCSCRLCNAVVEIRASETDATRTLRDQIGCVALVRAVQAGGPRCLDVMKLLYK